MPVTLTPYDENQTILVYTFKGNWSWSEFIAVDDDEWETFNHSDQRVDLIYDLRDSNNIPIGVGEILKRAGWRTEPASRGLGIIVKPPAVIPILLSVLKKISPVAASIYRTTDTFEDAIELIEMDRKH